MKKTIAITEVTVKLVEVDTEYSQLTDDERVRLLKVAKADYMAGMYADTPVAQREAKLEFVNPEKYLITAPNVVSPAMQAELEDARSKLGL